MLGAYSISSDYHIIRLYNPSVPPPLSSNRLFSSRLRESLAPWTVAWLLISAACVGEPKEQETGPPTPPELEGVAEKYEKEQETRALWQRYRQQMEEDLLRLEELELPAPRMAAAWGDFLRVYAADDPFSDKDEELRQQAETRLAYWQSTTTETPPPALRSGWDRYRQRMEQDFASLEELELPPATMVEGWSDFLRVYATDDPFSDGDDELRQQAETRLAHWREVPAEPAAPAAPPSSPPPPPASSAPLATPSPPPLDPPPPIARQPEVPSSPETLEAAETTEPLPPPLVPRAPAPELLPVLSARDSTLLFKVVGRSDNIAIYEAAQGSGTISTLEFLKPYFVLDDAGDRYQVSSLQEEGGIKGFVAKQESAEWNTREGLHFVLSAFQQRERAAVEAWGSEAEIRQYALTLDGKTHGPTFREELQTQVANRDIVPYPLLETKEIEAFDGKTRLIHHVLIPATVPGSVETDLTIQQAQEVAGAVTICVVFDASRSMKRYANYFVDTVEGMLDRFSSETRIAVGFILFRDPGRADDRRFESVQPMPVDEALGWLRNRVKDTFGGDDPTEPVLDAMTLAQVSFLWNGGTAIRGASRMAILVANRDAKLETAGLTNHVPAGLDAIEVGSRLLDANIPVFALQAGNEDRGNLAEVLRTLATETGGEFYRSAIRREEIRQEFSTRLASILDSSIRRGVQAAADVERYVAPREDGTVIALDVIDEDMKKRLEAAASKFHIADGGLVATDAWIFEAPDLYREKILIERKLLNSLVRFFNNMTDSTLSARALRESTARLLEAMIGENLEDRVEVQELLEKRYDIHFTTSLLSFDLEHLETLSPAEQSLLQDRIRESTRALADFLDMNTRHFNKEARIWMPVSYLP